MVNNIEVAEAATLRMKARIAIRGSLLSMEIKKAVIEAVDKVQLPLYMFYNKTKEDTAKSFIHRVIGGLNETVRDKYGEEINKCLMLKLT